MKEINYDFIGEKLYFKKLDNGLDVYLLKKEGFSKSYATFTTKFGSIDNEFGYDKTSVVESGIAHFLEHKMFETKKGDVFNEFVKTGAQANAFTSFTQTTYLFNTTSEFENNLKLLLDFVQELYISEESVNKEKGIIAEEIKMYEDNPGWRAYFGIINNLFKKNSVKEDIAGTIESINKIDVKRLKECYDTFYHPSNMTLFLIGDFDVNNILKLIEENQSCKVFPKIKEIKRKYFIEDNEVFKKEDSIKLNVKIPKLFLGIKKDMTKIVENPLKEEFTMSILLDLICGKSSILYNDLMKEHLIDSSFGGDLTFEESFGFVIIGGDTKKPEILKSKIIDFLNKINELKLDEKRFLLIKKKIIGKFISNFNSIEFIANEFTKMKLQNKDLFNVINVLNEINFEDINKMKQYFENKAISSFIINTK